MKKQNIINSWKSITEKTEKINNKAVFVYCFLTINAISAIFLIKEFNERYQKIFTLLLAIISGVITLTPIVMAIKYKHIMPFAKIPDEIISKKDTPIQYAVSLTLWSVAYCFTVIAPYFLSKLI